MASHLKHTRLAASGPIIAAIQFYRHLTNSLPAEYDMVVAVHDPPSNYSIDILCERFRAIELRRELSTTKDKVHQRTQLLCSRSRRDPGTVESHPETAAVAARERDRASPAMGAGRVSTTATLRRGGIKEDSARIQKRLVGQTRTLETATVETPPPTRRTRESQPEVLSYD